MPKASHALSMAPLCLANLDEDAEWKTPQLMSSSALENPCASPPRRVRQWATMPRWGSRATSLWAIVLFAIVSIAAGATRDPMHRSRGKLARCMCEEQSEEANNLGPPIAPGFVAASKFGGAVEGAVFKSGCQGLGYYRDHGNCTVSISEALAPAEAWWPPVLELDRLVPWKRWAGLPTAVGGIARVAEGPLAKPQGGEGVVAGR